MGKDVIRWGMIGCGDVTEVKSGPAFQKASGSALEIVMRRDAALCRDWAERHGVARWTCDADEVIRDPRVDAVYIATPPSTHAGYALRAIAAGKPVYVEKPLALSWAEADALAKAACDAGVPAFSAFYRRRLPYFMKLKELIDGGAIGTPRFATVFHCEQPRFDPAEGEPWRMRRDIAGGGWLWDMGSHTIDMLMYLLGDIDDVRAFSGNQTELFDVEDSVSASFRFSSGALGSAAWCFDGASSRECNRIVGTHGELRFATFAPMPIQLEDYDSGATTVFYFDSPEHIQQPMIQHVVDCLLRGDAPVSTLDSGARTSWVLDRISGAL